MTAPRHDRSRPPPRPRPRVDALLDPGLTDDDLPDPAIFERIWRILSRWAVPVMMTLAYGFLAATSETNNTGKAWMGVGLVFVLVVWFMFRRLTETAALARALSVGDVARLDELADRRLARTRRPAARQPFVIARAFARLLRGEHRDALDALDALGALGAARPGPALPPLAAVIRIAALIELGQPVDSLRPLAVGAVGAVGAPALAWLADGMIAWRDGQLDAAARHVARVIDDVRAGGAARSLAHVFAARIAEAHGDAAGVARHRAAVASLAAPEAIWLRVQAVAPADAVAPAGAGS